MVLALATVSTVNSNLVHATTPTSTVPGTITLYGKTGDISDPENDSNSHCVIEVLPGGTGRTVDYMLSNPDSKCFQLRVESISMEHMPPATQVLLTDDYFCDTTLGDDYQPKLDPSTNKNFWIKLKNRSRRFHTCKTKYQRTEHERVPLQPSRGKKSHQRHTIGGHGLSGSPGNDPHAILRARHNLQQQGYEIWRNLNAWKTRMDVQMERR